MKKPILLCGIQPTSDLTLGNYIGALLPLIQVQEKYECILLIADLHAYTIPLATQGIGFSEIKERSKELIKWAISSGVDINQTKIVLQSELKSELWELFYFLLTHCKLGELKLMTQYKFLMNQFKQANGTEPALLGVLLYPVLMAADILICGASLLSIGEDQLQHLELCSSIRERINKIYGKPIFPNEIKPLETQLKALKIMDLQDPTKKMSKSSTNKEGVIFLSDSGETIKKKIQKAKTDSLNSINLNKESQPGIHNLLSLYSALSNLSLGESLMKLKNLTYSELKKEIGDLITQTITLIQSKYKDINWDEVETQIKAHATELKNKARWKLQFINDQLNNFS